jgi:hypothetical protein
MVAKLGIGMGRHERPPSQGVPTTQARASPCLLNGLEFRRRCKEVLLGEFSVWSLTSSVAVA